MIIFKQIKNILRINHYIKNIIIFIPLLISLNIIDLKDIIKSIIAFVSFCLISSGIYLYNDISDYNIDKEHPIKRNRALASGLINKSEALFLFLILSSMSLLIAKFVNYKVFYIISFYFLLNIVYSRFLKKIPIIDVICIALGFTLRILVGFVALYNINLVLDF